MVSVSALMFFGAMGFILRPIPAAPSVTAWEMLGTPFRTASPNQDRRLPADYRPPA
jgi:hypothetical protein